VRNSTKVAQPVVEVESVRQMADLARFMVDMDYLSFLA